MDPLPELAPPGRLEEIRRAISHDMKAAAAGSSDQAYVAVLSGLAETIPKISSQLLTRFDAAWSAGGFDASLRWSVVLRDAGNGGGAVNAAELIERFLREFEAALRTDQMEAARAVMRKRRNVLRELAK